MQCADAGSAFRPSIPLVVVGALKAGGSGKTSVTLALARAFSERGLKVAILAYRLGPGMKRGHAWIKSATSGPGSDLIEVEPESAWETTSDEAVLLRRASGCRVFVTRHRARAWERLHLQAVYGQAPFDLILSDDGFQDPRLKGALRLLLHAPGERPGLFDLLPGGRFRETWTSSSRADLRLQGPLSGDEVALALPPDESEARPFHRRLHLPENVGPQRPWIVFCALGDNGPFLRDLASLGIRPLAVVAGRNHREPPLKALQACLARFPKAGILCTIKDFLKLESKSARGLPLFPVGQSITLDAATLASVEAYRLRFASSNLVHYPR